VVNIENMKAPWDLTTHSFIDIPTFWRNLLYSRQKHTMEAGDSSNILVTNYQLCSKQIPENSNLKTYSFVTLSLCSVHCTDMLGIHVYFSDNTQSNLFSIHKSLPEFDPFVTSNRQLLLFCGNPG
jgi:hypothetical protein